MNYAKLHLVLVVSDYANLCRKRNFSSLLNEEVLSEKVPRWSKRLDENQIPG